MKSINRLNLENLYKNGKGRRLNKKNNYLIFNEYGLKLLYEPDGNYYCLMETGIDPDEGSWIYYYKNAKENTGKVAVYKYKDSDTDVCFRVKGYCVYLDIDNFKLCLNE